MPRAEGLRMTMPRPASSPIIWGGKVRIIDFALSNALNSGIRKKLLRFRAGLSARAVVAPIKFRHFTIPYLNDCPEIDGQFNFIANFEQETEETDPK